MKFNKKTKKCLVAVVTIFLAILMLFATIAPLLSSQAASYSEIKQQIAKLEDKLDDLAGQSKELQASISANKSETATLTQQKNALDSEITILQSELDTLDAVISSYDLQIAELEAQGADLSVEIEETFQKYVARVRAAYEDGNSTYLSVLLGASSFSDLLTRLDMVELIATYDRNLLATLRQQKTDVETNAAETAAARATQQERREMAAVKQSELQGKYDECNSLIRKLTSENASYSKELEEIARLEEEMDAMLTDLLADLKKMEYVGGTFLWPTPGYYSVTSPYGYRTHPITGKQSSFHTGIDIGAPSGAAILAANTGEVITSGTNEVYGNYILIDHGGGYATFYGHLSVRSVKSGDYVQKGQTIGKVGTTGWSTGPHLHFEIRRGGNHSNPLEYYSLGG